MKQKLFFLSLMLLGVSFFMGQKSTDESPRWNVDPRSISIYPSGEYTQLPLVTNEIKQFTYDPRVFITPIGVMIATPNFRVHPSSGNQQCETEIVRHPTNPNIMFASAQPIINSNNFINVGVYVTTDGGVTWTGRDTMNAPNLNDQRGDPGPIIDKNGTFIYTHLLSTSNFGSLTGMGANYSTDNGATWSATFPVMLDANVDKNLAGTDGSPTSPYFGNSYMAWTVFAGSAGNGRVARTTNGGVTWDPAIVLNSTPANHFAQGHDVAVAPNGNVFVSWTAGSSTSPFTEDYVGIAKSTNGGLNYVATENAFDVNGSRSSSFNGWGIRTNGFARIDIDKSGGPRNGWIYIVSSEINRAPAGADADVVIHWSSDNGTTWSNPGVRVNQDALNNGKVQYFPAINVDDAGGVNVVYYDNRNFPSSGDSCSVFISRSLDGGLTWTDIEAADHHFKPKNLPGINTMGDYISITSGNGKLWPVWMDDKAGPGVQFNIWTTSVQIATYPLNTFNLNTPSAGSRIVSFPNSNTQYGFTWDTSASTASYKWVFGSPTTSPRKITLPGSGNQLNVTAGQLDNLLAGIGLAQGDSLVGQWDVWAFRNNQANDSLKASNGPRSITLKRGVPSLTAFNLNSPPSGTTITTSVFNNSQININWTRSGAGVTYKWKFGNPTISNIRLSVPADNSGYDTSLTLINNALDGILSGLGLNPGDSLVGQWSVWAYNATDSLKASQNYALTLKRQAKGDVIIAYDSTVTGCRTSRDSVANNLSNLGVTFDLYNRKGNTGTASISFRGYKKVIVLGEGTSIMSNILKDSLKSYLAAGTASVKSKLIIFGEDVGYHLDRTGSTYLDTTFARGSLGFSFIADRPGTLGTRGLIGITTNPNVADSTAGPWPDVLKKSLSVSPSQLYNLYKFRLYPDSMNAIGRISTTYNVSVMGIDIESLRPTPDSPNGQSVRRFVKGALDFVDGLLTSVEQTSSLIPERYSLSQNYPNPFNPTTKINFSLPKNGIVTLKVFDVLGKEVMTLINEQKNAGSYEVEFNAGNLASGAYFFRMQSGEFSEIKRMMLIK